MNSKVFQNALNVSDLERQAQGELSAEILAFLNGGAGSGNAVKRNVEAWQDIQLLPGSLRGMRELDTSFSIFGHAVKAPIGIAPIGALSAVHPDGERALINLEKEPSYLPIIASHSSIRLEDVPGLSDEYWWFQLYLHKNRSVSKNLLKRALSLGAAAIVLTVDLPVVGYRDSDRRFAQAAGTRILPGQRNSTYPNLDGHFELDEVEEHLRVFDTVLDHGISEDDLRWLIDVSPVPVLVKGVLRAEEAARYLELGASGVVVSNHGGRALEAAPATAFRISKMRKSLGDDALILVDGGIRRGDDIAKAICLGANMVLIGRPYVWGLAAGGKPGVLRSLDILWTELKVTMAFLGAERINQLTSEMVVSSTEKSL